jgi:hypothetical protein
VLVQTLRDYFDEYRRHRESKAFGPDGKPCRSWTQGRLQPWTIKASRLVRIGKESTPLSIPGIADSLDDRAFEYRELRCLSCGERLTGRQRKWCTEACRKRSRRVWWQQEPLVRKTMSRKVQ